MGIINIIVLSTLPALLYSFIIYITTPYKTINLKTGIKYLLGGFISVAILLTFFELAPFWQNLPNILSNSFFYPLHAAHIHNFIEVALAEELSKLGAFFIIEWLRNRKKKQNDHPLGTMFYMGMVSLGFSAIENIQYALNSVDPGDTIMWRAITAVIGHMVFGLFMGYWIALGRLRPRLKNRSIVDIIILKDRKFKRWLFVCIGLLSATILHGVYDLHLTLNGVEGISTLYMLLIMSLLGAFWCFGNIQKVYKNRLRENNL
jgi:RsiW-degrading membrane proteinase PrsW (M82 family)